MKPYYVVLSSRTALLSQVTADLRSANALAASIRQQEASLGRILRDGRCSAPGDESLLEAGHKLAERLDRMQRCLAELAADNNDLNTVLSAFTAGQQHAPSHGVRQDERGPGSATQSTSV